MKENSYLKNLCLVAAVFFAVSCNDTAKEKEKTIEQPPKDSILVNEPPVETKRGPVINIGDTISIKRLVLTMKDSAATLERVGMKLGEIYGTKLGAIIKKNNLKITGAPVAWYKSEKAPYFFEAGLPVDKKPAKPSGGAYIKEIGTDSVIVAHFYGPYDLLPQAYDALKDWMKDHKKKLKGAPYEVYIGDPMDSTGKLKDPYKVQTDVVFHWK